MWRTLVRVCLTLSFHKAWSHCRAANWLPIMTWNSLCSFILTPLYCGWTNRCGPAGQILQFDDDGDDYVVNLYVLELFLLFPPLSHPKPTSRFLDFSKPKRGQIIIHPKSWIAHGLCLLKAIFPPVLTNVCWCGTPKGTQIKCEESLDNFCCETGFISI